MKKALLQELAERDDLQGIEMLIGIEPSEEVISSEEFEAAAEMLANLGQLALESAMCMDAIKEYEKQKGEAGEPIDEEQVENDKRKIALNFRKPLWMASKEMLTYIGACLVGENSSSSLVDGIAKKE